MTHVAPLLLLFDGWFNSTRSMSASDCTPQFPSTHPCSNTHSPSGSYTTHSYSQIYATGQQCTIQSHQWNQLNDRQDDRIGAASLPSSHIQDISFSAPQNMNLNLHDGQERPIFEQGSSTMGVLESVTLPSMGEQESNAPPAQVYEHLLSVYRLDTTMLWIRPDFDDIDSDAVVNVDRVAEAVVEGRRKKEHACWLCPRKFDRPSTLRKVRDSLVAWVKAVRSLPLFYKLFASTDTNCFALLVVFFPSCKGCTSSVFGLVSNISLPDHSYLSTKSHSTTRTL